MVTLRAKATGAGRVVKWSRFKKGELVDCPRWNFLLTTVLTDVVTDVIDWAKTTDPTCSVAPLFPNGFTTASFDLLIKGKGFQAICGRRLVRGLFPLNPIAPEFGSNYDVMVTVSADAPEVEQSIIERLRRKYACEIEIDSEQSAGERRRRRRTAVALIRVGERESSSSQLGQTGICVRIDVRKEGN